MLNFILKNTEIQAVAEECGHATVISITERNWLVQLHSGWSHSMLACVEGCPSPFWACHAGHSTRRVRS